MKRVFLLLLIFSITVSAYTVNVAHPLIKTNKTGNFGYNVTAYVKSVYVPSINTTVNITLHNKTQYAIVPQVYCYNLSLIKELQNYHPNAESVFCQSCGYRVKDDFLDFLNVNKFRFSEAQPINSQLELKPQINKFIFEDLGGFIRLNSTKYKKIKYIDDNGKILYLNLRGYYEFYEK